MTNKINHNNKNNPLLNLDELLLNATIEAFVEEKLKHTPKSDYIYNRKLPNDLENLGREKVVALLKQLYADHYRVCRENEQFRTKNFKQYIQLRKLGCEEQPDTNSLE